MFDNRESASYGNSHVLYILQYTIYSTGPFIPYDAVWFKPYAATLYRSSRLWRRQTLLSAARMVGHFFSSQSFASSHPTPSLPFPSHPFLQLIHSSRQLTCRVQFSSSSRTSHSFCLPCPSVRLLPRLVCATRTSKKQKEARPESLSVPRGRKWSTRRKASLVGTRNTHENLATCF